MRTAAAVNTRREGDARVAATVKGKVFFTRREKRPKKDLHLCQVRTYNMPMVRRSPTTFSDEIRNAIEESTLSRYAIWKLTGVSQALLSRFVAGKSGMSMALLDKVAEVIDLHAVSHGRVAKAPKDRRGRPRKKGS